MRAPRPTNVYVIAALLITAIGGSACDYECRLRQYFMNMSDWLVSAPRPCRYLETPACMWCTDPTLAGGCQESIIDDKVGWTCGKIDSVENTVWKGRACIFVCSQQGTFTYREATRFDPEINIGPMAFWDCLPYSPAE